INHRAGKNLIGAFYQPPLVIIDPHLLRTLPARELTSGWSEIIKHAVIQSSTPGGERADLWAFLERNASRLLEREDPALNYLIYRNVALKAAVVEQDEREVRLRAFLNFGHTIGHAIEAADYQLLHGEAVAVGMRAAMRLGERMGTCDATAVSRLDSLLDQFGLPATATAAPDRVAALLTSDKKRSDGKQRWVLPQQQGGVALRDDVPDGVVREVLATLLT
ncbi:MAG TPA: 3-dehydroquinate synthase family protein, partial [Thermomicrobiales bacterium]|nr:3-dehydroquinate synthase family protein [Thermomicrobiales bacterium]